MAPLAVCNWEVDPVDERTLGAGVWVFITRFCLRAEEAGSETGCRTVRLRRGMSLFFLKNQSQPFFSPESPEMGIL